MRASTLRVLGAVVTGFSFVALGCGHTETHAAMLRERSPVTGRPVELYLVEQPLPARPFVDLAIVQAIAFGNKANPEKVTDAEVGLKRDWSMNGVKARMEVQ